LDKICRHSCLRYLRGQAAEALGSIGDIRAVEPLIKALEEDIIRGDNLIASAYDGVKDEQIIGLYSQEELREMSGEVVQSIAEDALVRIGEKTVPNLLEILKEENSTEKIKRVVRHILYKFGCREGNKGIFDLLVEMLKDENENARRDARNVLYGIAKTIGFHDVNWFIEVLQDDNMEVRRLAVRALEEIKDRQIKNEQAKQAMRVRQAIRARPEIEAISILFEALNEENENVRKGVAIVLGDEGDERAVELLIEALKDESSWIKIKAAKVLGKRGDYLAIEMLIKGLKDEDEEIRQLAIEALREIDTGEENVIDPLILVLGDENWMMRIEAISSLEKIGDRKAVELLIETLEDEFYQVRNKAAKALGEIGDERAVPHLIKLLKEVDWRIIGERDWKIHNDLQNSARESLSYSQNGKEVKETLKDIKDKEVSLLIEALGEIGDERAMRPLKVLLAKETTISVKIIINRVLVNLKGGIKYSKFL